MKYKDLFLDFDDTLYDTHGNSVIALQELFDDFHLERYFPDAQVFYDAYWEANIDLWTRYSKGEITRDYLIEERFRRPLMVSEAFRAEASSHLSPLSTYLLNISDRFLEFCSNKPGVLEGAHELMDYFDTIILSEDAGVNKPSPQFFSYALEQSGAQRETTLMIGDNLQTDILGALNAGIDALLYNRWNAETNDVEPAPTFVVERLLDITDIL